MIPKITTRESDPLVFQTGIWFSEANLLSPVIVEAEEQYFQPLSQFFKEIERAKNVFGTYGVIAGIGQYSLEKMTTAGLFCRQDIHFRDTTQEERNHDLDWFGEQVAPYPLDDEEVTDEMRKRHPFTVQCFGKPWIYTGPERMISDNYTCRVFHGQEPFNIDDLVKDVDGALIKKDKSGFQKYILFLADRGRLKCIAFGDPKAYDPGKFQDFGIIDIKDSKLLYTIEGEIKDFTISMHQEH